MGLADRMRANWEADKAANAAAREQMARDQQEQPARPGPAELARAAYQRGDGWFEVELDLRSTGNLNPYSAAGRDDALARKLSADNRTDALSKIEDEGWTLMHVNHVFVQLGEESRDKWLSSGQRVSIKGLLVGIYLFKRNPGSPSSSSA